MTHRTPDARFADPAKLSERLKEIGVTNVFDVAAQPRHVFIESHGQTGHDARDEAAAIYDAAVSRASGIARLHRDLVARNEPTKKALRRLFSAGPHEYFERALGGDTGYDDWFRDADLFTTDDSVASSFSAAAYLVDLAKVAKTLHKDDHPLHLFKRRADLATLALSQSNMDTEVSTLDLVNEILEDAIVTSGGKPAAEQLRNAVYPFNLPYDEDADAVTEGLRELGTDECALWDALMQAEAKAFVRADPNPVEKIEVGDDFVEYPRMELRYGIERIRAVLQIAPMQCSILWNLGNREDEEEHIVYSDWGLSDNSPLPSDGDALALATGLDGDALHALFATRQMLRDGDPAKPIAASQAGATYINFWRDVSFPMKLTWERGGSSIGSLVEPRPTDFVLIHRMVRLARATAMSFPELDALANGVGYPADGDNAPDRPDLAATLRALAVYLHLRKTVSLSFDAFLTIVAYPQRNAFEGERPFLHQVFGHDVVTILPNDELPGNTEAPKEVDLAEDSPGRSILLAALARAMRTDASTACLVALAAIQPPGDMTDARKPATRVEVTSRFLAAMYRTAQIPRLAGLTLPEGLAIWNLMEASPGAMLTGPTFLGAATPPAAVDGKADAALDVLERTLTISTWLRKHDLSVASLLVMTATGHSGMLTAEIASFLQNIRNSGTSASRDETTETDIERLIDDQLSRLVGSFVELSPKASLAMMRWADAVIGSVDATLAGYTYREFWNDARNIPEPGDLRDTGAVAPMPILYSQVLQQFAALCRFAGLDEEDLAMVIAPWTDAGSRKARASRITGEAWPAPDLQTVYWLGEYAAWRDSLRGSVSEARLWLHAAGTDVPPSIDELATLHDWHPDVARDAAALLFKDAQIPRNFIQIHQLAAWMQQSSRLGLSPTDLDDFLKLHDAEFTWDTEKRRRRVATSVLAAAHSRN